MSKYEKKLGKRKKERPDPLLMGLIHQAHLLKVYLKYLSKPSVFMVKFLSNGNKS